MFVGGIGRWGIPAVIAGDKTFSGSVTISGNLTVSGSVTVDVNQTVTGAVTVTGDLAVNGGDLTSTATTFNLLNATVTTLNIGAASTVIGLGAASAVLTLGSNATINGGAAANDDLTLQGTSNATRTTSYVILQPNGGNVGIGTTGPGTKLEVIGDAIRITQSANAVGNGFLAYNSAGVNDGYIAMGIGGTDLGYIQVADDSTQRTLSLQPNGGNVGIGTTSPDRLLHPELADAVTNVVSYPVRVSHITSGTPANSIGVGLEFEQETTADNNEVIATIEAVVTDVTATSEDADLVFKVMAAGAAAAEQFRIASDGGLFAQTLLQQSAAGLVVEWDSTSKEMYAETSAARFKAGIAPYSPPATLFDLSPKRWVDKATGRSEFGLIADEVAELYPDLVVYDAQGQPLGVKYHKLAVALLCEVRRLRELVQ